MISEFALFLFTLLGGIAAGAYVFAWAYPEGEGSKRWLLPCASLALPLFDAEIARNNTFAICAVVANALFACTAIATGAHFASLGFSIAPFICAAGAAIAATVVAWLVKGREGIALPVLAFALAAALALTGCQAETQVVKTGAQASIKGVTVDPEFDPEAGAVWVPIVCNANCGGFCENKALVKDGVVLRQKTDDTTEDKWASPQLRSCPRGRSKQQDTFGVDRLKYPMKRKSWSPEAPNGDKRGVDEWERIS